MRPCTIVTASEVRANKTGRFAAALCLASDDASYITRQTTAVDGSFKIAGLRAKNPVAKDGSYRPR